MRIVRFQKGEKIAWGREEQGKIWPIIAKDISEVKQAEQTGDSYLLEEVILLSPCQPSKVLCLGLNYRDHAEEFQFELPKFPVVFMKPATSVIGPADTILYPNDISRRLDYEGELAIVIGQTCHNLTQEMVKAHFSDYVLGFTCGNDITARDLQPKNGQWTIAKSFDTFMPLGPAIETQLDAGNLSIQTFLNDTLVQESNTKHLIFDPVYIVSYLSNMMTLLPGDVIITGTPSGVGPMLAGDQVSVVIEGIGKLTNSVALKYPEKGYKPPKKK